MTIENKEEENEKQIVIGLTGPIGSGCSTISKILVDRGFEYFSLSEHIKKNVDKEKSDATVLDYQDFGNKLRHEKGLNFFVSNIFDNITITDLEEKKKIVIDSIRNCGEIEYLRKKFYNFYLFGVFVDKEERWKRLESTYKKRRDVFEKVEERDQGEVWSYGQQVRSCMEQADVIIQNNENYKDKLQFKNKLQDKIDGYINLIQTPRSRSPLPNEYLMHEAYSISLKSSCLKRQVGAVIVNNETYEVISMGYNRIPMSDIMECRDRYGYCYRDKVREDFLKRIDHCAGCNSSLNLPKKCPNPDCGFDLDEQFKYLVKMLDLCRALHAEEDAIHNALISKPNFKDYNITKMYVTTFPCLMCAKKILNLGIKEIVFVEPYPVEIARQILEDAKVKITVFEGVKSSAFYKLFKMR